MALMHHGQTISQFHPSFGQPNANRAAVVHRALVHKILVLHHLLDVIGDVRAKITTAQCEFANGHFYIANIEKHHCLNVVDIVNPGLPTPASPPPRIGGEDAQREKLPRGMDYSFDSLIPLYSSSAFGYVVAHARENTRRLPVKKTSDPLELRGNP